MNNFEKAGYSDFAIMVIKLFGYTIVVCAAAFCFIAIIYTLLLWYIKITDWYYYKKLRKAYLKESKKAMIRYMGEDFVNPKVI